MNIDIPSAVTTALAALPKIMAYREDAAKLGGFNLAHFDQLQLHAFAAAHAHAEFLTASAPPEPFAPLNQRAIKLRDTMYLDAVVLAHRGLLDSARVAKFKTNVGYKNLAFDLLDMCALLREGWDKIASRSGVQVSELVEAELLGQQLLSAIGARQKAAEAATQAQAQRQRNFTLFSRSYDQVRRAIGFLRWDNDDLDEICPSLFAGRGGSRRKEAPAPKVSEADSGTHAVARRVDRGS